MSQPRRKRRRRRRRGAAPSQASEAAPRPEGAEPQPTRAAPGTPRRRRRRRPGARRLPGPQTLEDVIADARPKIGEQLTAPADGQVLEEIIGDLQSVWGVPQYPQEFRITIKVAEERGAPLEPRPVRTTGPNGVTREKAPAAPRVDGEAEAVKRERAPRRRRGRRRRRPRSE